MQMPALLYGTLEDVQQRCATAVKAFLQGQPWLTALEAEGSIATVEHPGLILLGGSTEWISQETHYHCALPLTTLAEQWMGADFDTPVADALFAALLERPWGVLNLLSTNDVGVWFKAGNSERWYLFLQAAVVYWDLFAAEGRRYCWGFEAKYIWDSPTVITSLLATNGVPAELVSTHLPREGLRTLLLIAVEQAGGSLSPMLWRLIGEIDNLPVLAAPAPERPPEDLDPHDGGSLDDAPIDGMASSRMVEAMNANDVTTVQRLIEEGEDVNAFDLANVTYPLLWAVRQGHVDLVRYMLERGADIAAQGEEGESPLMVAAFLGDQTMVSLLLEHGADPSYRTQQGWNALDYADLARHQDIVALLMRSLNG